MRRRLASLCAGRGCAWMALAALLWTCTERSGQAAPVIDPARLAEWVARFNATDDESVSTFIPNAGAGDWLAGNIPRFECPDAGVEEIYHFRWWSFRKHLRRTEAGFVITEFLVPMRHAGAENTISCATGHHLAEGRWLRDGRPVDDYTRFWLRGHRGGPQPHFHKFSSWYAAAVWDRALVTGDLAFATGLLDELVADYRLWETERRLPDGLFWQHDVRDGMEESISGSRVARQARPTINAYMFANARAIAAIARLAGREALAAEFEAKAAGLKQLCQSVLWDDSAKFFKVRREDGRLAGVREAIGYIPWAFGLPDSGRGFEAAWAQFTDPGGFRAPYGLTTAERRHPEFRSHGCCGCEWDGAVWPFATSQTLTALAALLRTGPGTALPVTRSDYFEAFLTYTRSHRADGRPYIGEYLDETTGHWLKGRQARSRFYNHSTFADLLITGVVGLCPRAGNEWELDPLLPPGTWDWFCLEDVKYHGHMLTVIWDRTGARYGRGAGLQVVVDGQPAARSAELRRLTGRFP